MIRSASLLLVSFAAVWFVLARTGGQPVTDYLPVIGIAAIGVLAVLAYIFRHGAGTTEFNPLAVYAALAAFAGLAVAMIWLFSRIHPLLFAGITGALCVLTLILTLWRNERQRLHRAVGGFCEECGYDLRHSTERCPECGSDLPEELARRRRIAAELAAARRGGVVSGTPPAINSPPSADDQADVVHDGL